MDIRDLQYFAVVAEHQNMGRAAEALGLSATALSNCLRRLERSVGAQLIQRAPKGIVLTAAGTVLLKRIGTLQGTLNDVRHEAADLVQGRAGHIHVGTSLGPNESRLAHAYTCLLKEAPGITLEVSVGETTVLSKRLHKGEIDFCIAGPRLFPAAEFVHEHLYDVPFVVFASAHHRFAKRKRVSIADIAAERWASASSMVLWQWQALFRAFENSGLPQPSVALKSNSSTVRTIAIAYSDYLGLTTRLLLHQEMDRYPLVELPVEELTLSQNMSIIYRKGAYLSPAALRLIAILKARANETSAAGRVARMK